MKKMVLLDPNDFKRIIRRRQRIGADRFDEVWNGVYVMAPNADNVHQFLAGKLFRAFDEALDQWEGSRVLPGANVTDQDDWTKNYRVPDVLVFLPGNPAEDRVTHYFGGSDFAVEVISKRDRSRKKFEFYARVGVRELMLVDRFPWSVELYRNLNGTFELVGKSEPVRSESLKSAVLPLVFRLLPGEPRPQIEATQSENGRVWLI